MRYSILLPFLFACTAISAQDALPTATAPAFKRLQLGVNFSPDYCYRTLRSDGSSIYTPQIITVREELERPTFGYTTGLSVYYQFTRHIGLELGAQYSQKGFALDPKLFGFGDPIDPHRGFVYDTSVPQLTKFRYHFTYVDIPLRLVGRVGKGKLQVVAGLGVAVNVLVKATTTTVWEYIDGQRERERNTDDYNYDPIGLSPMASIGVGYRLSDHFALQMEPTFRYGVLKLSDTPIQTYLWNAGVNFTGYYAL